jgi:hypothetical protein
VSGRSEERREGWNDGLSDVVVDVEKRSDWLTTLRWAFREAYAKGRGEAHVHLVARYRGGDEVADYCARFVAAATHEAAPDRHGSPEPGTRMAADGSEQETMLVDVRQLLQHPEWVSGVFVASEVRLQRLDDCLRRWVDAPDFRRLLASVHRTGAEDWEFAARTLSVGHGGSEGNRERECEMVETGSQGVQAVPDVETPGLWWIRGTKVGDPVLVGLRPSITAEGIPFGV